MQRHPFAKRRIRSKLKHRDKLFMRYDPRFNFRVSFYEPVSAGVANFLHDWASVIHQPLGKGL